MRYEIKRGNEIILNHEINGKRTKSAPAVDFVDIEFSYPKSILFKKNDTLVFKGQTYFCDPRYNTNHELSSNLFKHTAKFVSENYRATEILIRDSLGKVVFDIEGNLNTLLSLAVSNLNRVSSGWSFSVPTNDTPIEKFQVDGDNVMAFLVKVSGTYEMPFSINNKVISFIPVSNPTTTSVAYGKGNGLLDIKKSYNNSVLIPNTVYGIGGDEIELDTPIKNQSHIDANGVIEGIYSNPNITPTTQGTVTTLTSDINVIATTLPYFNLNNYRIDGVTPIINFENGSLGGLSFYVENFTFTNGYYVIFFKKRLVDGVELPNDTVKPEVGVNFNITDIKQPTEVVDIAKAKLLSETTEFLNNGINKAMKLDVNIDPLFNNNIMLNSRLHIIDSKLGINNTFFVNEIREHLQDLQKKEVVLEITHRNIFKYTLDRIHSDLVNMAISDTITEVKDINNIKLPAINTNVVNAYNRGDLAYLKAENIELVELPPIAQNASNALNGVNTLNPKVNALEIDIVKKATIESVTAVDGKATNAQTLAGTANTNASNALNGVNSLTPKVNTLETDIATKASIASVNLKADKTELTPLATKASLATTETKASNALLKATTNESDISGINNTLPTLATKGELTPIDTKATNALTLAGTADTNANSALSALLSKADIYNGELFSPVIETTDDPIIGDARVELNMRDDSSIDINPISGVHSTSGGVSFKPIMYNGDLRIAFMINNIFNTADSEELPMNTIYSDNNGFIKIKQ